MRAHDRDIMVAEGAIVRAEADLGRELSRGERRDLLKDNFPWASAHADKIEALVWAEGE